MSPNRPVVRWLTVLLIAGVVVGCRHVRSRPPATAPDAAPASTGLSESDTGTSATAEPPANASPSLPGQVATPFRRSIPEPAVRPLAFLGERRFLDPVVTEEGTLAISADGTLLASGGRDGVLRLFDAGSGELLARLGGPGEPFSQVVFAAPRLLVTGDDNGELRMWDLSAGHADGVEITRLPVHHTASITALAVDPTGRWMLSADYRGNAVSWDLPARKVIRRLWEEEDTGDGVIVSEGDETRFAFSADGALASVHDGDYGFSVFETAGWTVQASARWTWEERTSVAHLVFVGAGDRVRVVHHIPGSGYVENPNRKARITDWSTADGTLLETRLPKVGEPMIYGLSPDGRWFAVQHWEHGLRVWRLDDGVEVDVPQPYGPGSGSVQMTFSADGRYLAVGDYETLLNVVDLETGQRAHPPASPGPRHWRCAALAPDGTAALSGDGRLYFWEPTADEPPRSFVFGPEEMVFVDGGSKLAAQGDHVWTMDLQTHELLFERLDKLGYANAMDATDDGETVVYGDYEGRIAVLDGDDGELIRAIETDDGGIRGLALSDDGKQVASTGSASRLRIRDLDTGYLRFDHELEYGSKIEAWAGSTLVVSGDEGLLVVDPKTGEARLVGLQCYNAALSADGRLLAWGEPDGSLALLDLEADEQIRFDAPSQQATALAFDPAAERLLVARVGGGAEIWSVADLLGAASVVPTAAEVAAAAEPLLPPEPQKARQDAHGDPLPAHAIARLGTTRGRTTNRINAVRFAADGEHLWVADYYGNVLYWNPATGQSERALDLSTSFAGDSVQFSPDQRWLATFDYYGVATHDPATGAELATVAREEIDAMAVSPDGRWVVVGCEDGSVRVYHAPDLRLAADLAPSARPVEQLVFTPDSSSLAVVDRDTAVRVFDTRSWQRSRSIEAWENRRPNAATFAPDGVTLLVATGSWIERVDITNGDKEPRWEAEFRPFAMELSPDGKTLALVGQDHRIQLWDPVAGRSVRIVEGHTGMVFSAAFSGDGRRLATAGEDQHVRIWKLPSGEPVREWPAHAGSLEIVEVTADGRSVIVADRDGMVRRWSAADGSPEAVESGYAHAALLLDGETLEPIRSYKIWDDLVAVSPDGTRVAALDQQQLAIWDLDTGAELHRVDAYTGYATTISWSADGAAIATGGTDRVVRVWDPETAEQITAFRAGAEIHDVAFTDTGLLVWGERQEGCNPVLTAGVLATGEIRWQLTPQFSHSQHFALDPLGTYLAATDFQGLRFYDVETGVLVARIPIPEFCASDLAFAPDRSFLVSGHYDTTALIWDTSWLP